MFVLLFVILIEYFKFNNPIYRIILFIEEESVVIDTL